MAFGPQAFPEYAAIATYVGIGAVVIGLGFIVWSGMMRPKESSEKVNEMGDDYSIKTGNISGSSIGEIGHEPRYHKAKDVVDHLPVENVMSDDYARLVSAHNATVRALRG